MSSPLAARNPAQHPPSARLYVSVPESLRDHESAGVCVCLSEPIDPWWLYESIALQFEAVGSVCWNHKGSSCEEESEEPLK